MRRNQQLVIPGRLDGMNEIIGAARTSRYNSASQKRDTQDRIILCVRSQRIQPLPGPFWLDFLYVEPNAKRDPDNIVACKKYILDALQEAGTIVKDSMRYVLGWTESWKVADAKYPAGIYIILTDDLKK